MCCRPHASETKTNKTVRYDSSTVRETNHMIMELSAEVLDGLQLAGDSARIPDKLYEKLILSVCESLLQQNREAKIPGKSPSAFICVLYYRSR